MAATVSKTATDIVNQPFTSIGDLVLCSDHDLSILRKWNERLPIWHDECVHRAISQRVPENPGKPAVTPERFVALYFEKSKWFIVAILGVIKAGGAYVLLDPSYPRSRMQLICDELRATTVLASVGLAPAAQNLAKNIVAVGEDAECLREQQDVSNLISACPDNPLYVVFTPGPTGKPKGIIMEHGAFCSWARTTGQSLCLDSRSRVLQFSSHAFLVIHRDVLLTLMFGACICVPSEPDWVNNIARFMMEYRINWANLTPSVAALLSPEKVPNLQTLVFTGEPMSRASLRIWANKVNVNMAVDNPNNVGRGVASAIWLVDPQDHDKLVPIGAIGELVIEGTAIARGYVNNTEKNTRVVPPRCCRGFARNIEAAGFTRAENLLSLQMTGQFGFWAGRTTLLKCTASVWKWRKSNGTEPGLIAKHKGRKIDSVSGIEPHDPGDWE
ncbi:hypothetical protein ABOM_001777 [Aspergillus bombycis]|uniref:AMP-dependent synthetase/ligase domain-containing protein n=1 Tax=Aspergillus bombycis TaxID=109264 RepID=A0A1F8AE84_9EURO|nr:hypothetical protein ABOM_001777 [Aspergillus bombycis]OGM49749.1 hypothetical protein ABOM_001777 [Aspergillus bombycis]